MGPKIGTLILALALAACATTPPPEYYTLDMTPSGATQPEVNIRVRHFAVLRQLDRSEMAIRSAPTRIEYYGRARWAAGVGQLLTEKLAMELGLHEAQRPTIDVTGRLIAFEQTVNADGVPMARLAAAVSFSMPRTRSEEPFHEALYEVTVPMDDPGPAGLATALSRAVEDLAGLMARDAGAHLPPGTRGGAEEPGP